jgi:8-oxo-dGTP pyrophosphatase MutT (NUDIX family)
MSRRTVTGVPVPPPTVRTPAVRLLAKMRWLRNFGEVRTSAALAVFARRPSGGQRGEVVVALVRHRTTFAFRDLVFGRWVKEADAAALAARVTPEEATVLLLRDYVTALAFMYAESRAESEARMEGVVIRQAAARFRILVGHASVVAALGAPRGRITFGVPRGRPRRTETAPAAAAREWREETGAARAEFSFRACERTLESSREIPPASFRIHYHCAVAAGPPPSVGVVTRQQLCEIAEVLWASMADLDRMLQLGLVDPGEAHVLRGFRQHLRNARAL